MKKLIFIAVFFLVSTFSYSQPGLVKSNLFFMNASTEYVYAHIDHNRESIAYGDSIMKHRLWIDEIRYDFATKTLKINSGCGFKKNLNDMYICKMIKSDRNSDVYIAHHLTIVNGEKLYTPYIGFEIVNAGDKNNERIKLIIIKSE